MKYYLIALSCLGLIGCGTEVGPTGAQGPQGATGNVGLNPDPVIVVEACPGKYVLQIGINTYLVKGKYLVLNHTGDCNEDKDDHDKR